MVDASIHGSVWRRPCSLPSFPNCPCSPRYSPLIDAQVKSRGRDGHLQGYSLRGRTPTQTLKEDFGRKRLQPIISPLCKEAEGG